MNRLNIFIVICLCSLASCTGGTPTVEEFQANGHSFGSGVIVEHGVASIPNPTPVPSEILNLLSQNPAPVNDYLPGLPYNELPAKLPAGLTEFWVDGNNPYARSLNAIPNGTKIGLDSSDGNPAWVIYQIPNLLPMTELVRLRIELSDSEFGGPDQGYWVGVANYDKGSWKVMAHSQAAPFKNLPLTGPDPFISPANNFYMFLVITGNQSVSVDRVGLEFNTPAWVEVVVDDDTENDINTGWMPSIAFNNLDIPMVAYCELSIGKPRLAVGDRGAVGGLGNPGNWDITHIDENPEDSGETPPDIGAKVKWPDIAIDEFNGMPRVSMIYDEIDGKEEDSRAGISVMLPDGRWINYRLGWIDGAEWTSIDSIPGTPVYGFATSAKNPNWPSRNPYDFTYITFDINDLDHQYDLYRGFGEGWRFPHLKYDPDQGLGVVSVYGSSGYREANPTEWNPFFGDPNSNDFGSLAVNPTNNRYGSTYSQIGISKWDLLYVEYDADFDPSSEIVDTIVLSNGAERIGDVSQLAYHPDGTPAIAYTVFDGNFVEIKYAEKIGEVWESQIISSERSLAESPADRFVVDLAIDSTGVPAVCYRHRDTDGNNSLRVVINEG